MSGPGFVHLHVHTSYSLLEGALPLGKLLDLAVRDEQPALGIADTANLFGALEFSEKAAGKGVQPIIGCEIRILFREEGEQAHDSRRHGKASVVLIALDEPGFRTLSHLVSRAYLEGEPGSPAIDLTWLEASDLSGLVCLSGGPEGAIDPLIASGLEAHAHTRLDTLHRLFDDRFYVELQRHGRPDEARVEPHLIEYAYENGVPLVATNEPYFPAAADHEAHDALIAIAEGSVLAQTERRKLSDQHYFRSRAEMLELFADLPEALENSVEIARRVNFRPQTRGPILPYFAVEEGTDPETAVQQEGDELARQAHEGLRARMAAMDLAEGFTEQDYVERLEHELKVIRDMKFPGYFLIVADFIKWSKERGIPVGPGRGSGAGSLVAHSLTITDLDPLKYALLFERFLNPERVSMPDFDIDFCQERREEVIQYVQEKYGAPQVAQIITFGTLQARAALRDVGRVLQMPYGQVDRICKLVPANPANPVSIGQALEDVPQLRAMRDEDETVAQLIDIAQAIEGLYRHASTHAAGIVIGDRELHELVPLYRDPRSDMQVTQYSLKWVEPAGLVKFDFLGLKTLTVIEYALRMANRDGKGLTTQNMPMDDPHTFEMLRRGETMGVFQIESAGMRRALLEMRPDRFEDLIALVALFRPGPMDNIPAFNARKHGEEEFQVLHESMEPILSETYGIIVYQEQVMQIAQVLSGYTLGEADMLRRAMGKKIKAEMDAQKERFVDGAVERGIDKARADQIFELLAKFANYGFNKSHAAAYALVSYQTAYLKAHYPSEFIAASMTLDMNNTDKLAEFKRDADRLGIAVVPPSVNRSEVAFDVKDGEIVYSLCAIKGVGRQVAEHIVEVRGDAPFVDLADFAGRIDPRIVNKRTAEGLVNAGAFDELVPQREQAFEAVDAIVGTAQRTSSNKANGIVDMFSTDAPEPIRLNDSYTAWTGTERLEREYGAIGFHLSGHPLDEFAELLDRQSVQRWLTFEKAVKEGGATAGRLAGTVVSRQDRRTRKGTPMAIMMLSDPTGSFECLAFSEQIESFGDLMQTGNSVILEVEADARAEGLRLRLIRVRSLKEVAEAAERRLEIHITDSKCLAPINTLLKPGGNGTVLVRVNTDGGAREYEIELKGRYRVNPDLVGGLKSIGGVNDVRLD